MARHFQNTRAAFKAMISYRNYRWAARLSGFLGIVLIVSFMTGQGFEMIREAKASYDLLFLLTLFTISLLAYIIGWIIEIIGGALMLLSGIAIAFYVAFSQVFVGAGYILLMSLPFIVPGIFYVMSWRNKLLRMKKASQS